MIVSVRTGIPTEKITEAQRQKLLTLGDALKKQVVGHDDAVDTLTAALFRASTGLQDKARPIGAFYSPGQLVSERQPLPAPLRHTCLMTRTA